MKLEDLAGALTELKEKLFISISEDAATEANENLLTELRKRIMDKQFNSVKRQLIKSTPEFKPSKRKLNQQQAKFLKAIPVTEIQDDNSIKPNADSIQLQKSDNGYSIGIDSELPQQVKDLAKVTNADVQQYLNTLTENAKKQPD